MYKLTHTSAELSFIESKIGLKSFIVGLLSIQVIFHVITSIYIQIISYFQLDLHLSALNPRLLDSFALDTWLIVALVIFSVVGYSIVKK